MSGSNATTYNKILSKGIEANLPVNIGLNKLRFTTDTGRLFLDNEGVERVEITDFIKGKTKAEIIGTLAPLPKFYLASDTQELYYYDTTDDEWKSLAVTTTQYAVESGHSVNADTASYAINAATSSYASTADKATKDGVGNTITNTYAPLNSPVFTGTPVVPDVASGDNSSKIANTKFVNAAISASTYSTMTVAEGIEGASTVSKVMTAANLKGMLQGSTYVYSYAPCVEADFDFGELTATGEVYNQ